MNIQKLLTKEGYIYKDKELLRDQLQRAIGIDRLNDLSILAKNLSDTTNMSLLLQWLKESDFGSPTREMIRKRISAILPKAAATADDINVLLDWDCKLSHEVSKETIENRLAVLITAYDIDPDHLPPWFIKYLNTREHYSDKIQETLSAKAREVLAKLDQQ